MVLVLLAFGVFALSLLGGFGARVAAGRLPAWRLHDLTALASGLLLASAVLVVIPEGFDVAAEGAGDGGSFTDPPAVLGAAILLGFGAMLLLEGLGIGHSLHEEHHDHALGHDHGHVHHPASVSVLATGLTVHAVADGLAIGSAAAAGEAAFSFLVATAVVIHRVPAAFSLGVFTLHEATARGRAILSIVAFALATPVMLLVSYLVLDEASERLVALALLFSAGTFVYVATVDTLPAVHNPQTGPRSVAIVVAAAAAFALVFIGIDAAGWLDHGH